MTTYYWNRQLGHFVDKKTGHRQLVEGLEPGVHYPGTIREWYETLPLTVKDLIDDTGSKPVVRVGADALLIFECSVLYMPDFKKDEGMSGGNLGTMFEIQLDQSLQPREIRVGEHRIEITE